MGSDPTSGPGPRLPSCPARISRDSSPTTGTRTSSHRESPHDPSRSRRRTGIARACRHSRTGQIRLPAATRRHGDGAEGRAVRIGRRDEVDDGRVPSAGAATTTRPALIFFNNAVGSDRSNAFYLGWAQTVASKGVVGILPDLRNGTQEDDYHALVRHLTEHAAEYGIDAAALAVYAGSGNVFRRSRSWKARRSTRSKPR